MENLAGNKDCDRVIERELTIARINIKKVEPDPVHHEVPYTLEGELGSFTFHRAWYYWVVNGPMPLKNALELYADPAGRHDVRVTGHCGCPPPEAPWITWRDDAGNEIIHMKEKAQIDAFVAKGHIKPEQMKNRRFDERPENFNGFIESYHIDSEVGLRLFADMIRKIDATLELPVTVPG
jgi:hypothetical protein